MYETFVHIHRHKPNRFTVVPVVCELGRCPVHDVEAGVETAAAAVSCCVASKSSNSVVDPVKTLQIVLVCRKYEKISIIMYCERIFKIIVVPSLFGRNKRDRE